MHANNLQSEGGLGIFVVYLKTEIFWPLNCIAVNEILQYDLFRYTQGF